MLCSGRPSDEEVERDHRAAQDGGDGRGEQHAVDGERGGGHAARAAGSGRGCSGTRRGLRPRRPCGAARRRARGRARGGSGGSPGRRRRAPAGARGGGAASRTRSANPAGRALEHRHLDERLAAAARARARTRGGTSATTCGRRQVLQHEVADEPSAIAVLDAVETVARTRRRNSTFGAGTASRARSSIAGETSSAITRSKRSASAPVIRPGPQPTSTHVPPRGSAPSRPKSPSSSAAPVAGSPT